MRHCFETTCPRIPRCWTAKSENDRTQGTPRIHCGVEIVGPVLEDEGMKVFHTRKAGLRRLLACCSTAWFDDESETDIRAIWHDLHEAGISSFLHDGPYRPHITLAIYGQLDTGRFATTFREVVARIRAFVVHCTHLGSFNNNTVAHLAAERTGSLDQLQMLTHAVAGPMGAEPNPRQLPEHWNPHCSLARYLDAENYPAIEDYVARSVRLPIAVEVTRVGLIDTPAEIELAVFTLDG